MAAGQYHYGPSPFYSGDYKFISLEDLFYPGRQDPRFLDGEHKKAPVEKKDGAKEKEGAKDRDGDKGKDGDKTKEADKSKVIEIKVNLCCDNCAWKVKHALEDMEEVEKVDCCQWTKKVTVKGTAKPEHVLKRVQKVKKDAEMWPKKK